MAGIITRIGQWIDEKWEDKATQSELKSVQDNLDKLIGVLKSNNELFLSEISSLKENKELADLKTRIEKLELASGMYRKVDPTKPPVAKSAFSM